MYQTIMEQVERDATWILADHLETETAGTVKLTAKASKLLAYVGESIEETEFREVIHNFIVNPAMALVTDGDFGFISDDKQVIVDDLPDALEGLTNGEYEDAERFFSFNVVSR